MHQSVHTMHAYKQEIPAPQCADDLAMMAAGATRIHRGCIAGSSDSSWDTVTFVPSKRYPGARHPIVELARKIKGAEIPDRRALLELGPGIEYDDRSVRADRFNVPDKYRERVQGRHVLLLDDTWVTGAKIQSAAVTLRDAGASRVTALCVARWCKVSWSDHKALLDSRTDPYDPFVCPVSGKNCVEG